MGLISSKSTCLVLLTMLLALESCKKEASIKIQTLSGARVGATSDTNLSGTVYSVTNLALTTSVTETPLSGVTINIYKIISETEAPTLLATTTSNTEGIYLQKLTLNGVNTLLVVAQKSETSIGQTIVIVPTTALTGESEKSISADITIQSTIASALLLKKNIKLPTLGSDSLAALLNIVAAQIAENPSTDSTTLLTVLASSTSIAEALVSATGDSGATENRSSSAFDYLSSVILTTGIARVTVTKIEIVSTSASIAQNSSTAFTVFAVYSDGSRINVTSSATWSSATGSVASIAKSNNTLNATGLAAGSTTISASFGGQTDQVTLAVTSIVAPQLLSNTPASGATGIAVAAPITFVFDKNISSATASTALALKDSSNAAVAGTASVSGATVTFTPSISLNEFSDYTFEVNKALLKDVDGNSFGSGTLTITFTTTGTRSWAAAANIFNYDGTMGSVPDAGVDKDGNIKLSGVATPALGQKVYTVDYTASSSTWGAPIARTGLLNATFNKATIGVNSNGDARITYRESVGATKNMYAINYSKTGAAYSLLGGYDYAINELTPYKTILDDSQRGLTFMKYASGVPERYYLFDTTATTVGTAVLYGNHADASAQAMTHLASNRSGDWLFALETIPSVNQREIWARKSQGGVISSGLEQVNDVTIDFASAYPNPDIAVDKVGNMVVLWRDKRSGNAYISMHASICSTSCTSWPASQKISGTSDLVDGSNSYHSVKGKMHGSGFYAAWVQYDTGLYAGIKTVWGSEYIAGSGWTTPEVIQTDRTQDAQYPIVGFDDADNPIVAYYQFGGGGNAIRATRRVGGTWEATQVIYSGGSLAQRVKMISAENGINLIYWTYSGANDEFWGAVFR